MFAVIASLSFETCSSNHSEKKSKPKSQFDTTALSDDAKNRNLLGIVGYKVFQSIRPQMRVGCAQVTIELFEDARLAGLKAELYYYPDHHAAQMIFTSDEDMLNPDGPEYKPAILLTRGNDGAVISRKTLEVPCARIDTVYLDEHKIRIAYLFTLDYSAGMGSYNGPASYFVHLTDTGMCNYKGDNGFATTLKSAWAVRYANDRLEVWSKICRPTDDDDFAVTTKKCYLDADSFKSVTTVRKGVWEAESDTGEEGLKEFFDNFSQ